MKKNTAFKGYLYYKTITSQNVSSEAHVNNFFITLKIYVLFSRYSNLSFKWSHNLPNLWHHDKD